MKSTIYFIRHGQTDWNVEGRLQGKSDIPLNATGREQAKKVATLLRDKKIHAIYSSPLSRSLDTAKAIATHHDVVVGLVEEFKECGFGIFEGLSWDLIYDHPEFNQKEKDLNPIRRRYNTFCAEVYQTD